MNLEGRIDITLKRHAPAAVSILSSRPQLAQRLLGGRTPEEAARLVGMVFSLCGQAQRVAVQAACEAAMGQEPEPSAKVERGLAVLLELAREHVWSLHPPRESTAAGMLALRQAAGKVQYQAKILAQMLHTQLLGEPANAWLARDFSGIEAWVSAATSVTARLFTAPEEREVADYLLPPLQRLSATAVADLASQALALPAFCAQPTLHGQTAETGAIARLAEHPLLLEWVAHRGLGTGARLFARLLELAELPQRLCGDLAADPAPVHAWSLGDGVGMAGVETARGLLLHVVRLHAGRVDQYRIVAPTEWNFHPAGALARALAALLPGADLEARAQRLCQSLDPCVAYSIEVQNA